MFWRLLLVPLEAQPDRASVTEAGRPWLPPLLASDNFSCVWNHLSSVLELELQKGKNLYVVTRSLWILFKLTFCPLYPSLPLCAEETKANILSLQLNQTIFSPLSLSDH
jgi:hypothetical protein